MANAFNDKKIKSLLKQAKTGRHAVGNGLYFRISAEGSGFWAVRYSINGRRRELNVGKYPVVGLAQANLKAAEVKLVVKEGNDPLAEKNRPNQPTFLTVNQLAEDWLQDCRKRLKHPKIPERLYKRDIAPFVGELKPDQVTARDIRSIIQTIAASDRPTIANDALLYCKQIFRHGIKLDLIMHNPADAFSVSDAGGAEQSRTRALSLEELKMLLQTLRNESDQFCRENYLATILLVSLGVRKSELIEARWSEFDFKKQLWNLPESRSKMGAAITIPLSEVTCKWLEELRIRAYGSDYVFPNRRASKTPHMGPDTLNAAFAKLFREQKIPCAHFTVHDLRRTCRSLLAAQGTPGHVAERCLNHKLKGVEGIYDRYDYLDERRIALNKLSSVIEGIAE